MAMCGRLRLGNFDNMFTLADVGVTDTIVLRGVDSYHSVFFSIPKTQLVKTATMHIQYHFSPGLLPDISHLKVSLNGTLFAVLPVKNASGVRRPERRYDPRAEARGGGFADGLAQPNGRAARSDGHRCRRICWCRTMS